MHDPSFSSQAKVLDVAVAELVKQTSMRRWAKLYEHCQSCGTEVIRHQAKGLCVSCYAAAMEKRQKSHVTRRIGTPLPNPITKEELEQRYQSGQSLNDIARHYNCTRQYVHKLMRQYKIIRRTQRDARNLALEQGKIEYTSNVYSPGSTITHQRRTVDESFFKTWTPEMAWVLGVIYTDGCLNKPSGAVKFRVTISQKETELLEKVLSLLKSNERIIFKPKRGIAGALYTIKIVDNKRCRESFSHHRSGRARHVQRVKPGPPRMR